MHLLSKTIKHFVHATPNVKRVLIAYSGGIDSTVLLHAAVHAGLSQPISAIHVNHQLSKHADSWQAHCERVCKAWGVPGVCLPVDVRLVGGGLEQAARDARMSALQSQLFEGDLLLMGHHAQDQVETFFLRLARGAGSRGLQGIPSVRAFDVARVGRPLLAIQKTVIKDYAKCEDLNWIEDDSNDSVQFDRNFLRLQVLPLLQQRWPSFTERVTASTALLREEQSLLGEYLSHDLRALNPRPERVGCSIELLELKVWRFAKQYALVRHWLIEQGYRLPSQATLSQLVSVLTAQADKAPLLLLGDCELRRFGERLYCLPKGWRVAEVTFESAEEGLKVGPDYRVVSKGDLSQALRSRPHNRQHSQTLKKLLQEYQLEPWLREYVPIVMMGNKVAAVGDLWVDAEFYCCSSHAIKVLWP